MNLGDSINTDQWEQEVTISEDDSILYFFRVGPGVPRAGIFGSYRRNGVWQKAVFLPPPINPPDTTYGEAGGPYFVQGGRRIYYVFDILLVHSPFIYYSDWEDVGVEEGDKVSESEVGISEMNVHPNPFISFASVPGHSSERFTLYDISGRKVGTYRGDRIGEGLAAGVYFLNPEGKDAKPLRVVKLR